MKTRDSGSPTDGSADPRINRRTSSVGSRCYPWALLLCCSLVLSCITSRSAHAQIKLDRFFPPVIAAGEETGVTAEGKFPKWPPNIECDRDDIEIAAAKDSGKFTVKIAANVAPGVAWVRLYDEQSASALVPLIVAPISVTAETEPNNKRSEANPISLPAVVAGRLAKSGDSDAYQISIKAGQQLVVSVTGNELLKSPMDAVIQLTDPRGNVLAQDDDSRGLDPQFVYGSDSDQELLIRIFAFPETPNSTIGFAGSDAFVYTLDITTGPFLDHIAGSDAPFGYNLAEPHAVVLSAATDVAPAAASISGALGWSWVSPPADSTRQFLQGEEFDGTLPAALIGHITKPQEMHTYSLPAVKGTKYRAEVRSKAEGYLLDSKLTISDQKTGSILASNDDASRNDFDAAVDFTAKEDDIVDVSVSDMIDGYGPRHFYRLTIRESQPECHLTLAEDHFVIQHDKPLEIPVTVSRIAGFSEKVQITATGLPAGVAAEFVVSEPKGDTAKSVKLKLTASEVAVGHGTFQVVGTFLGTDDKPTEGKADATYPLRPSISLQEFWLTILPAPTEKATP